MDQLLQPSPCAAACIEHIQAANIGEHGTEYTLFKGQQRILLSVVDFGPGVKGLYDRG